VDQWSGHRPAEGTWGTARLAGRPPAPDDAPAVLALHHDPRAVAHNPGDRLEDLPAAHALVERWVQHWHQHGTGYSLLSWHGDRTVLGVCGAKLMTLHGTPVLNLLYRLDPSVWGRGVATEAATAVVGRARRHRLALPVVARVRPANRASARVALAAGLRRAPELDTRGEDGPDELYAVDPA